MSLLLKLEQIVARYAELQAQLSAGNLDSQKFVAASKEYADLGPLVESVNAWRKAEQELVCKPCKLAYPVRDDIPVMLEDQARRLSGEAL